MADVPYQSEVDVLSVLFPCLASSLFTTKWTLFLLGNMLVFPLEIFFKCCFDL